MSVPASGAKSHALPQRPAGEPAPAPPPVAQWENHQVQAAPPDIAQAAPSALQRQPSLEHLAEGENASPEGVPRSIRQRAVSMPPAPAPDDADRPPEGLRARLDAIGFEVHDINRPQEPITHARRINYAKEQGVALGRLAGSRSAQQQLSAKALDTAYTKNRNQLLLQAPMGQGYRQVKAFREGFELGKARAHAEHRTHILGNRTELDDWHGTHGTALASRLHIKDPSPHKMNWSAWHHPLRGVGQHEAKVQFALSHITHRSPETEAGRDMRPLMHAGAELALHNGREFIAPHEAIQLMDALRVHASGDDAQHALSPDELRMFTAGLVAVWNPQVSAEVALHLLQNADPEDPHAQAMAEGLGIGMGWKGMDLIHEFAEADFGKEMPAGAKAMLDRMDKGQAVGRQWLVKLEMSLSRLQGHSEGNALRYLEAVLLLRKHFIPPEGAEKSSSSERAADSHAAAHPKKKKELPLVDTATQGPQTHRTGGDSKYADTFASTAADTFAGNFAIPDLQAPTDDIPSGPEGQPPPLSALSAALADAASLSQEQMAPEALEGMGTPEPPPAPAADNV